MQSDNTGNKEKANYVTITLQGQRCGESAYGGEYERLASVNHERHEHGACRHGRCKANGFGSDPFRGEACERGQRMKEAHCDH